MRSQVDIRQRAPWIDDDPARVILRNISKGTPAIYYRVYGCTISSSGRAPQGITFIEKEISRGRA